MSQIEQQEQRTAPSTSGAPKRAELFWRIIAGLMMLTIAWIAWVLYQITPRSVVTPLVYATQVKTLGAKQPAAASAPTSPQPPAAPEGAAALVVRQPEPEAAAAALSMERAQAGAQIGAHQSSPDVQAEALEKREGEVKRQEQLGRGGLKLSTEITTPLAERKAIPEKQQGNPESAPAVPPATDAAGKDRP